MNEQGAFTFVLHSHMPYARRAGRWPHGEEWVYEAIAETYIPLLNVMRRLDMDGVPCQLTINLTPILLEQLNDAEMKLNFISFLDERIRLADEDIERFRRLDNREFTKLAMDYRASYQEVRSCYTEIYHEDIVGAFRDLQDRGRVEILTSAATHGFLPLLSDASIQLQLRTAIDAYIKFFGRNPAGIWLPECAYRPGLEVFLEQHNLTHFFAESTTLDSASLIHDDKRDGPAILTSMYYHILFPLKRWLNLVSLSPNKPYYVHQSDVIVLARDAAASMQVWSADTGYPGDFAYREFHKRDGSSGLRYWSVTGDTVELGDKEMYNPTYAQAKIEEHARHFTQLVEEEISNFVESEQSYGIVAANFDTELFGHWWFEGVSWLEAVLRQLVASDLVELTTVADYLKAHPTHQTVKLTPGSWGAGGDYSVWDNESTSWIWDIIRIREERMTQVVRAYREPTELEVEFLNQASRELLLLEASDWPFLITMKQAGEYASHRFRDHVDRFDRLLDGLTDPASNIAMLEEVQKKDNVFPHIDYRWFST